MVFSHTTTRFLRALVGFSIVKGIAYIFSTYAPLRVDVDSSMISLIFVAFRVSST
jgi:hypothetical protein